MSDDRSVSTTGFTFDHSTVISLLFLASFVSGITWLVAGVLTYVWRGERHPAWEDSHYRYHIRTLWMGVALSIAAVVVTVFTLGIGAFIVWPALAIWFAVRCVKALLAAQKAQPIPNPETWLF